MKIVGDAIQDGLPGHFNAYFTAKKDGPVGPSPDLPPDVKAVQEEIDTAASLKPLPATVTIVPDRVDLSMIEEGKARLDRK